MSQYTFNPDDPGERMTVRTVLNAFDPVQVPIFVNSQSNPFCNQFGNPQNGVYQQGSGYQQIPSQCQENYNLGLRNEIVSKNVLISELKSQLRQKDNDLNQYIEKENNNNEIIQEMKERIDSLTTENEKLKRRLNKYESVDEDTTDEILYLNVDSSGVLHRTNDNVAFYKAQVKKDGKTAIFQFNIEKAPHREACKKKEKYLEPFCDIVSEEPDANDIQIEDRGEVEINQEKYSVTKKVKIKLVRNS